MCTTEVKSKLFISYCTSFYGITSWMNFNNESYSKINVAYKSIFRKLFDLEYERTTYNMLNLNIRPFPVIERNLLHGFYTRISESANVIVKSIFNHMLVDKSPFLSRYFKCVYFNQSIF